jgi:hypothetical protein
MRSVLAIVLTLSLNALGRPTDAWELGVHQLIAGDAVRTLPEPLRSKLQGEIASAWASGVEEPRKDYRLYLGALRGMPPDGGGADVVLQHLARKVEAMITSDEPLRDIAHALGQVARVIQDLNVPLHTVWGETLEQHWAYENQAYFHDWPGPGQGYRGFRLVESYKCFAFETARRSHASVSFALWAKVPRRVIEETWDHSVNDTANLWLSVFYRALGPEKSRELSGIPGPLGEIGRSSSC